MEPVLSALWPVLGAGVLFTLFKLGYYCLGLIIFRHPATAGIVLWAVTGDFNLLLAAVFFELLWLDLFYVGTYVPPDNLFAYLVFVPLVLNLGLAQPQDFCVVLLACLPFAALGGKLEARMRFRERADHKRMNEAIDACGAIEATASGIIMRSLGRIVFLCFTRYCLIAALLYSLAIAWVHKFGAIYRIELAGWGVLLCLAALGGLMALRIPWAGGCFLACVLVAGGLYIF